MFRRLVTGMLALLFTVGVIGGAPVLLLRVAGNPLPEKMPSLEEITQLLMSPDNGSLFLRVLTWVGWLAWATFTISVLVEIPAQIRGRRSRRIPGLGMQQKVAGALVGSIITVFVGSSVAHAGVAAPVVSPAPAMAMVTTAAAQAGPHDWHAPLTTRAAPQLKPAAVGETKPVVPAAPAHLAAIPLSHNGPATSHAGFAAPANSAQTPPSQGIAALMHGTRLGLTGASGTPGGPAVGQAGQGTAPARQAAAPIAQQAAAAVQRAAPVQQGAATQQAPAAASLGGTPMQQAAGSAPHGLAQAGSPAAYAAPQGAGPQGTGLQAGVQQSAALQAGAPQGVGPKAGAPQSAGPKAGAPQSAGLQAAGLQAAGPQAVAPQAVSPPSVSPQTAAKVAAQAAGFAAPLTAAQAGAQIAATQPGMQAAAPAVGQTAQSAGQTAVQSVGQTAAQSASQTTIAAVGQTTAHSANQTIAPATVGRTAQSAGLTTTAAAGQTGAAAQAGQQVQAGQMVYIVRKGDWLGRIALRFTGDFDCYNDIAKLNPKLVKDPHHIEPGWHLILPADARDRGIMSHATGSVIMPPTQAPQTPAPQTPTPQTPTPPQPPAPEAPAPQPPTTPPSSEAPAPPPPSPPSSAPASPAVPSSSSSSSSSSNEDTEGDDQRKVPATLAAGAGLAAASVLAAHVIVHRRQLKQTQIRVRRRRRVTKVFMPTVETAVRQMAKHRAVDRLDAGLRALAIGLRGRESTDMPDIAAVWQAGGDIAVILTSPCDDPPEPFEERWQNTWALNANAPLPDSSWAPALLPGLLTFATWPQGGDLLVDAERTGLLTITGDPENCENLLRALAAEAASAQWTDSASVLLAGLNPLDMRHIAELNPSRVRTTASIPEALARISKRAAANASILHETQAPDTMSARINNLTEGFWATHVLFIADPWGEHSQQLRELDAQLAGLRRVGVAVIATHPTATRWSATVSSDRSLHMAWLAVAGANARQLSTEELAAQVEAGT